MAKHLVDLDEDRLSAARTELGTKTIKDTVNEALRLATARREQRTKQVDTLAVAGQLGRARICDFEVGYSARSSEEWDRT